MSISSLAPGPRGAFVQSVKTMRDAYGYTALLRRRYRDVVTLPTLNRTVVPKP